LLLLIQEQDYCVNTHKLTD